MKLDEAIQAEIASAKKDAEQKVQELIGFLSCHKKKITLIEVRNLRKDILDSFKTAKTQLPLKIYEDIETGFDSGMNGLKKKLRNLQSSLKTAKLKQELIHKDFKEISTLRDGISKKKEISALRDDISKRKK